MDITGREVARLLGLGQEATARLLASGLAGPAHVRGGSHLYARDRVLALLTRPVVVETTPLPPECDEGVLVARVNPLVVMGDLLGGASGPWRLAPGRAAVLAVQVATRARVPLVVTVCGYVVGGADVVGRSTDDERPPRTTLATEPAGDWFRAFDGRRLPTGPGAPLLFWRCQFCPPLSHGNTRRPTRPAPPRATAG